MAQADVFSYSAIISACEKSFQWQLALHFFQVMREANVEANDITFNAVISFMAAAEAADADFAMWENLRVTLRNAVSVDRKSFK